MLCQRFLRRAILPLVLCAFTVFRCQQLAEAAPDDTLRVGILQGLTGIAAEDGLNILRGAELAIDDLKKRGDQSVSLVVEDDGSQPRITVSAFHKLSAQGVRAIIGPSWDTTANSVTALAAQEERVLVIPSVMPEALDLPAGKGFVFSNSHSMAAGVKPFVRYLEKHKVRTMSVVSIPNPWGRIQKDFYLRVAAGAGIKVRDSIETATTVDNDVRAILMRLKAHPVDLFVLVLNRDDLDVFLRRRSEVKLSTPIFATHVAYEAFRRSQTSSAYEGLCFPYPERALDKGSDFAKRFTARFGEPPRLFAANSYDAVMLLLQASRTAAAENRELQEVMQTQAFSGLMGEYTFKPSLSLALGDAALVCIHNGQAETLP